MGELIHSLSVVDARAKLHDGVKIGPFAVVGPNVEIGEDSSIWPGTVIRADSGKIAIGSQTCIQDNSVVHGDADVVIGDRVVIGHRVGCHARSVGAGGMIGNGAVVKDLSLLHI